MMVRWAQSRTLGMSNLQCWSHGRTFKCIGHMSSKDTPTHGEGVFTSDCVGTGTQCLLEISFTLLMGWLLLLGSGLCIQYVATKTLLNFAAHFSIFGMTSAAFWGQELFSHDPFYLLSLSWADQYCISVDRYHVWQSNPRQITQCFNAERMLSAGEHLTSFDGHLTDRSSMSIIIV